MLRILRTYGLALLLLTFVAFPLYWMTLTSLKPQTEVFRTPPTFLPATWTLEHYISLFQLTDFGLLFMNSLKVCLLSTVMALAVGLTNPLIFSLVGIGAESAGFVEGSAQSGLEHRGGQGGWTRRASGRGAIVPRRVVWA